MFRHSSVFDYVIVNHNTLYCLVPFSIYNITLYCILSCCFVFSHHISSETILSRSSFACIVLSRLTSSSPVLSHLVLYDITYHFMFHSVTSHECTVYFAFIIILLCIHGTLHIFVYMHVLGMCLLIVVLVLILIPILILIRLLFALMLVLTSTLRLTYKLVRMRLLVLVFILVICLLCRLPCYFRGGDIASGF